jgi:Zn-finger nucleic acid-binding protein
VKCPVDTQMLLLSERDGFEVDYCPDHRGPDHRGVGLDRGDFDTILERAGGSASLSSLSSLLYVAGGRAPHLARQAQDEGDKLDWPRQKKRRLRVVWRRAKV